MTWNNDENGIIFREVGNHEEQHSIWPGYNEIPHTFRRSYMVFIC
jgi:uncharacterized protein YbdZ (MbtH family)